jgi:hypothetical protein
MHQQTTLTISITVSKDEADWVATEAARPDIDTAAAPKRPCTVEVIQTVDVAIRN